MASAETLALRARSVATNSGINPGAAALALAVPFLFLHIKYQPGVRVPLASTHLGLELSDAAIVIVALVALREGLKTRFAPLRAALPLWIASAALLLWISIRSGSLEQWLGQIDRGFDDTDQRELVRDLLARLPERERRIVELRFFEDKVQSVIAEELGISQMHVSRLLARALGRMKTLANEPPA